MILEFRRALPGDLDAMLAIVHEARAFMKQQGLPQWQNGYPSPDVLREDIENGEAFLMTAQGQPVATAALLLREEPDYRVLTQGSWGSSGPYAALHRVALASNQRGSGLATQFLQRLEGVCLQAGLFAIRIDTHRDNRPMQRFLTKNGFVQRGAILLGLAFEQDKERIVFDKQLAPGKDTAWAVS